MSQLSSPESTYLLKYICDSLLVANWSLKTHWNSSFPDTTEQMQVRTQRLWQHALALYKFKAEKNSCMEESRWAPSSASVQELLVAVSCWEREWQFLHRAILGISTTPQWSIELNLGPLQLQRVLLTAKPSSRPSSPSTGGHPQKLFSRRLIWSQSNI